ncbi:MAG: hypothetical protein ACXABD_19030 [Candidatus Thorarchaeota archaeon]
MAINAIAGIIQKGKAGAGGSLGSLKRGPKIKTSDGKIIRGKGIITIQSNVAQLFGEWHKRIMGL